MDPTATNNPRRKIGFFAIAAAALGFKPGAALAQAVKEQSNVPHMPDLPTLRESHSPEIWGHSASCARMVRKNKMRRLGIGGARI